VKGNTVKKLVLCSLMASVGLLTACGSKSDDKSSSGGGNTATTTGSVTLTGVVTKGLMANADVFVYPVDTNGVIGSSALAQTTSDVNGHYELKFTSAKGTLYVVKVQAKADGSTTHKDEVTGATQNLPAGFAMRAPFVAEETGTVIVTRNVTAFTEMAVDAAEEGAGGLTVQNAKQGISTVSQLIGFDPTQVAVKSTTDAVSEDEKKQAVLLTAVSQLVSDGSLGCTTGSAGEKAKCVVGVLADSASLATIKLTFGLINVSAILKSAVETVLDTPALAGNVTEGTMTGVVNNLDCTGTACASATVVAGSPIDNAKSLFTQIKSDWMVLFSRGGATDVATAGAVNKEAFKFKQALDDKKVGDIDYREFLLLRGVKLYDDFVSGKTTYPATRDGWWSGTFQDDDQYCALYSQSGALATIATDVSKIKCRSTVVNNHISYSGSVHIHEIYNYFYTISVQSGNSFTYSAYASKKSCNVNISGWNDCSGSAKISEIWLSPSSGSYSGSIVTAGTAGQLTGLTLDGELPAILTQDRYSDGVLLYPDYVYNPNGKSHANLSVTRVLGTSSTQETTSLSGSIVTYLDSAGTQVDNTLTVKPGSKMTYWQENFSASKKGGSYANLDVVWGNSKSQIEGILDLTNGVLDKSGTRMAPTDWKFVGALRNADSAGVMQDVITGTATAKSGNWASYDAKLAESSQGKKCSPTNTFSADFSFVGTVTAPSRPKLELTFSTSAWCHQDSQDVSSMNMQYRSLHNGTPRTVMNLTANRDLATGQTTFKLTEAASNLSVSWLSNSGATGADLMAGATKIGRFDRKSLTLTFSDHTFMSLDLGL
jgi:hypothetical protein